MITMYMFKSMKILSNFLFCLVLVFGLESKGFSEEKKLKVDDH